MRAWVTVPLVVLTIVFSATAPTAQTAFPRDADGKPNLNGIWQVMNSAAWDIQDHPGQLFPGLPPRFAMPAGQGVVEGNEIPYQPSALKKKQENYSNRQTADPENHCFLPGVPRITYMPHPFQIFQTPTQISIVYEYLHAVRNIYMNSPHPKGPIEFWMGDSRARWEGDTLVVDVVHFSDKTWFDRAGNFHSEELHVVERYSPMGPDRISYEVTIEDPKVFTRPWKMSMPLYRRAERNAQLLEFECHAYVDEATGN